MIWSLAIDDCGRPRRLACGSGDSFTVTRTGRSLRPAPSSRFVSNDGQMLRCPEVRLGAPLPRLQPRHRLLARRDLNSAKCEKLRKQREQNRSP